MLRPAELCSISVSLRTGQLDRHPLPVHRSANCGRLLKEIRAIVTPGWLLNYRISKHLLTLHRLDTLYAQKVLISGTIFWPLLVSAFTSKRTQFVAKVDKKS